MTDNIDLFIITGGSKGLGSSLVSLALSQKHHVINLSRTKNLSMTNQLQNVSIDLQNSSESNSLFNDELKKKLTTHKYQNIHLILNAAQIEPIDFFDKISSEKFIAHMNTNFITNALLLKSFLTLSTGMPRTITALSTGAATQAIAGWSAYCSSKAALFLLVETLKLEFSSCNKTKIYNFNPGVLDTEMQQTIRSVSSSQFPRVDEFVNLKNEHVLKNPTEVANELYKVIKLQTGTSTPN